MLKYADYAQQLEAAENGEERVPRKPLKLMAIVVRSTIAALSTIHSTLANSTRLESRTLPPIGRRVNHRGV